MKHIFESYTAYVEKDTSVCAQANAKLGFAHQLMSLAGYDPMSLSPVFAATNRISSSIALMPWELKSWNETDIPPRHYFYSLFDNCIQTRFMFMKCIITDVLCNGNGYALIKRNKDTAKPESLIYLPHGTCSPVYYQNTGKLYYNIPLYNNKKLFDPIDVLHFYMNSIDGIEGRGILDFARNAIRLTAYTEKAAYQYFSSGMRLTGILSTDNPRLTAKQRTDIRDAYLSGINSSNGVAVLEAGMRFEQLSNSARDAALIDSRIYNVQDIARFYNLLPPQIGELSHTQYNSIEQSSLDLVNNTLSPYVKMIEEELNRKLIMPSEKNKLYIDLNEDALIRSDRQSYASYLDTLVKMGAISINEAREMLGMHPIPDGDKYVIPYTGTTQDNSYNNSNQSSNNSNQSSNNSNQTTNNSNQTTNNSNQNQEQNKNNQDTQDEES